MLVKCTQMAPSSGENISVQLKIMVLWLQFLPLAGLSGGFLLFMKKILYHTVSFQTVNVKKVNQVFLFVAVKILDSL